MPVYLPDYKGGSIVNLMSSISGSFGVKSAYGQLKYLKSKELNESRNVILMVLDGLGFEYLKNKGKGSILMENLRGKMTSVFPATTASAITTFLTGVAPQQHAITGWYMHLREIGIVSAILTFAPRIGGLPFTHSEINVEDILPVKGLSEKINARRYFVTKKDILNSDFTRAASKKSKLLGYSSMNGFFNQIKKAIKSGKQRKYIYAYWSELDSICHEYGTGSKKAENHFKEINKRLQKFVKSIKNTNTALIITSDHGLIDSTKNKLIKLKDHPKLKECFVLPFCGEPRAVYCYVHPSKAKQFERYVKTRLSKFCWIHKSEELVKNGYFGLFKANPRLADRVGDYVLIMKGNYIFKDGILDKIKHFHIGNHGGVSREEMIVPLVVIKN